MVPWSSDAVHQQQQEHCKVGAELKGLKVGDVVNTPSYFGAKVVRIARSSVKVEYYHPYEGKVQMWVPCGHITQS